MSGNSNSNNLNAGVLGGGGGGGDIWSTNAFSSYESPLKDLLDRQNYTVEDLLQEDELLQELRGCHDVLIAYLSTEAAVTKLVQYVIQPPPLPLPVVVAASSPPESLTTNASISTTGTSNANHSSNIDANKKPGEWLVRHLLEAQQSLPSMMEEEHDPNHTSSTGTATATSLPSLLLRQIRFPYMACEIICCEIPILIQTLVDGTCQFTPPLVPTCLHPNNNNSNNNNISDDENHCNNNPVVVVEPPIVVDSDPIVLVVVPTNPTSTTITTTSSTASSSSPVASTTTLITDEIITSGSQGDMVEVMAHTNTNNHYHNDDDDNNNNDMEGTTLEHDIVLPEESPKPLSILDLLFSLLYQTPTGELDDYRAGYFDKILSVLFRKRPDELTTYINSGGVYGRQTLIQSMFRHLYSHSIMQIAQRLLLPQRPTGQPPLLASSSQQQQPLEDGDVGVTENNGSLLLEPPHTSSSSSNHNNENGAEIVAGDDGDDDPEALGVRCDWGNSPQVLDMLLDTLVGPQPRTSATKSNNSDSQILDLSLNASEVLITIIQNSMLSSTTMLTLTGHDVIARVVDAATTLPDPDYFSPHESLLTSAMNVLESLVLQLGGYGAVGTMTLLPEDEMLALQSSGANNYQVGASIFEDDPPHKVTDQIQEVESDDTLNTGQEVGLVDKHLISDLGAMLESLPTLLERLSFLLRHPSTTSWTSPTQFSKHQPVQLLGNSRLRIVRVLESLVLLGDPYVDSILVQSNCLEICLDFFWDFQWCSMLHQSVANLLVHVFEGQNIRFEMQKYFLVKCNLLGRLMDSFSDDKTSHNVGNTTINCTNTQVSPPSNDNEKIKGSNTVTADNVEALSDEKAAGEPHLSPPVQALRCGYMGHVIIICQALVHAYTNSPHDQMTNEDADGLANDQMRMSNENSFDETDQETSAAELPKNVTVDVDEMESPAGVGSEDADEEATGPKDIYGDPLLLFEIVHTHPLADKWQDFVETTLAAETAIQSTPLGGLSMQSTGIDMMLSHRPGLADEGYMMGDDGEGPPAPPRGMLGGDGMIHMDENDLDIAASLMAGLSYGRPNGPDIDEDHSNNSADSEKSYNSGETARDKVGYAFDDPLGKAGGLGIELDKLTKFSSGGASADEYMGDDDDGSHSSDEEESDSKRSDSGDVPIIDLFAGNFNYEQSTDKETSVAPAEEFANFAAFETAGSNDVGVFVGIVEDTGSADHGIQPNNTASTDLDNLFGKGDHAELLELDDLPIEDALSPIKPITSFEESNCVPVTLLENSSNDTDDLLSTSNEDVKANLFGAQDMGAEVKRTIIDVEIEAAPSDELMADQIEPVSLNAVKEDVGQL